MRLKCLFAFLKIHIFFTSLSAQDIILKKDGGELPVVIQRIEQEVVVFKRYKHHDQRIRTIPIADIAAIKYQSGVISDGNGTPITIAYFEYAKYNDLSRLRTKRAIPLCTVGGTFLIGGAAMLARGYYVMNRGPLYKEQSPNGWMFLQIGGYFLMAAGLVPTIAGGVLLGKAAKYKRKAQAAKAELSFIPHLGSGFAGSMETGTGLNTGITLHLKF